MDVKKEQRVCIKFCARLGNNETEALGMVQQAFGEESMSCARLFDWRARFRAGQTSVDDDKHTGRPFSCAMPKIIAQVQQLVRTDRRRTIQNHADEVGIGYATYQRILTEEFGMHCIFPEPCTNLMHTRFSSLSFILKASTHHPRK